MFKLAYLMKVHNGYLGLEW